jgi:hypothetical protein
MSKYSVFVTGSLYLTDLLWTNVSDIIDCMALIQVMIGMERH